jgi:predicted PurR-regulated permease PerM
MPPRLDITRTTLAVLFIGALIIGSFRILQPFLPAIIWAVMIVVATWPILLWVQARLRGRRLPAAAAMIVALVLTFVLPLWLAVGTILEHADAIVAWAKSLAGTTIAGPPHWLQSVPLAGPRLAAEWSAVADSGGKQILARLSPHVGDLTGWFVAQVGSFGVLLVEFLMTLAVAAILYVRGEQAYIAVQRFASRLAGEQGERALAVAGRAIRGVALGVVVTAIVQAVLGGVGLAVCGIPFVSLLTSVIFVLAVAQIGAAVVLVPAVIWLYWSGETTWGTVLLVWGLVVLNVDNFLRPVLIQRGAKLPLLLIFVGVIGGLMALGLVGIFVGPVVLAISYELLTAWVVTGELAASGGRVPPQPPFPPGSSVPPE